MKALGNTTELSSLEQEDEAAVQRFLTEGTPIPADVEERIDQRAKSITEEIRRTHGVLDDATWQKVIGEDDEE